VEFLEGRFRVSDLMSGELVGQVPKPGKGYWISDLAILPGAKHIAACVKETRMIAPSPGRVAFRERLCIYDLTTGELLGFAAVPEGMGCSGLFSEGHRMLTIDYGEPPAELVFLTFPTGRCPVRVWEIAYAPKRSD
jgi:hypothetical protein